MKGEGNYEFSFWGMTAQLAWMAFVAIITFEWAVFFIESNHPFSQEIHDSQTGKLKTVWAYWDNNRHMRYGCPE